MSTIYVDMVLDTGGLVRVECPSKHEDALFESIENCMKRQDWWAPSRFDGCHAEYLGLTLDRVNMTRVVGTL